MSTTLPYFDDPRRATFDVEDVLDALRQTAESDEFILQSKVAALEQAVAERVGARHGVATASGTAALTLALYAAGVGAGDDVVTPAFSFVATAGTVVTLGARPVFADVDPETGCLDVAAAREAITPHTRALLPAYLFNAAPDMPSLRHLAAEHDVTLIEDSAVALGAVAGDRPAGRHGQIGIFSFFPAKPLGGIADGGMLVTDDDELALRLRMLRNHGQDLATRFLHHAIGFNARMDEVGANLLLRRLPQLDAALEARRARAERYDERLGDLAPQVRTPRPGYDGRAVYTYVIRAQDRDGLRSHLAERGVETAVYYPVPLPLQPAFAHLGHREGDFRHAERLARECLALPLHPGLPLGQIDRVADEVAAFLGRRR